MSKALKVSVVEKASYRNALLSQRQSSIIYYNANTKYRLKSENGAALTKLMLHKENVLSDNTTVSEISRMTEMYIYITDESIASNMSLKQAEINSRRLPS